MKETSLKPLSSPGREPEDLDQGSANSSGCLLSPHPQNKQGQIP